MWGLLMIAVLALVVVAEFAGPDLYQVLIEEDGVVETLSAISYFIASLLLIIQIVRDHPERWSLFVVVLCFGLRELDFDKRFSTMGVFKSRAYVSPEVPLGEKILGVLIIIALLATIYVLIRRYFRVFMQSLLERNMMAWSLLMVGATLVIAKSLDGIGRKLEPLGIRISDHGSNMAGSIEEVMELAAAILLLVVCASAFRAPRKNPDAENGLSSL